MTTVTQLLFAVLVVLIACIYVNYYSKYNNSYEIIQTYLDKLNIDMLYERNPIIIYDSIKTPKQLLGTLFKYSYVSKTDYVINNKNPIMNRAKFSFVYSTYDDAIFVNLINPSFATSMKWAKQKKNTYDKVSMTKLDDTNINYVTVKLKPYQVLIIPMHWIIQTDATIVKHNLDDFISLLYFQLW